MSQISRRTVLRGFGATAAVSMTGGLLNACSGLSSGESDSDTLVIVDSGGTYSDYSRTAFYDPFTKETGIKIEAVPYESTGTLMTQLKQSPGSYDVLSNSPLGAITMQKDDLLLPIDYDSVGRSFRLDDLSETARAEYSVASNYWAQVLAYRTDVFDEEPQGWVDFWDTSTFPGPRSMQGNIGPVELEFALIADGVPANQDALYPLDIDRALDSLSVVQPDIATFWNSGALSTQLISQKEVVLTTIWNGRAQALVDDGAPVAIAWTQAMRRANAWMVPSGSEKADKAMQFIDFASQPDRQAEFAKLSGYGPTNQAAFEGIDEQTAQKLPSNPEWVDSGFDFDDAWWATNETKAGDAWNRWSNQ